MTPRLAKKIIVITGGASGIGLGTVEKAVAEGAFVVAGDVQDDKGAALEARFPGKVAYQHCDVTVEADVAALMATAQARFGGLDGLFNNAGVGGVMGPVETTDVGAFKAALDLLVTSVFLGTKHAVPLMAARGGGSIVNTASIAGLQAGWGPLAYSTAKAGVIQFSKVAAAELAVRKIRVNAVCPGLIATAIFGTSLGMPREVADQIAAMLATQGGSIQPAGRAGEPADIAEAVVWLLSDVGSFVTGTHIVVDGGITVGPRHAWDPTAPQPIAEALGLDQAAMAAAIAGSAGS
ncbi:MAG: SDR family oxidoreductase [Hyphomonadaceae bacterium]|jgi:NAD(P)-dependent dehydrogenase (short-subunit alcohol dehydrogenase family)|nr:SDR family oxidoreductase [Hyphomonadaceae bacterium]